MTRKNLVFVHLESIARQAVAAFPEAFPNLDRFARQARSFPAYISSATSTQMALTYLLHGNDFEMDAAAGLSQPPAANNPSLFTTLAVAGYRTEMLCLSAFPGKRMLPLLAGSVPPVAATHDFAALLQRFEAAVAEPPFAIYVWNLVSHIEHAMGLAPLVRGVTDLVAGAFAVADHALGAILDVLDRRGRADDTTVIVFGDHGEDYWTHGFKRGLLHGAEPYTHVVNCPLLIRDAALAAGTDRRVASTIDLAPTALALLGVPAAMPFAFSGRSLLQGSRREHAFSQNYTASQPDAAILDVRRAFSVTDDVHTLLVSGRGLELFNHRLDPTNHCNLLHFFDLDADGGLIPRRPQGWLHSHFATAAWPMLEGRGETRDAFATLRRALRQHLADKVAYVTAQGPAAQLPDLSAFDRIDRHGRDAFFARPPQQPRRPRRTWIERVTRAVARR